MRKSHICFIASLTLSIIAVIGFTRSEPQASQEPLDFSYAKLETVVDVLQAADEATSKPDAVTLVHESIQLSDPKPVVPEDWPAELVLYRKSNKPSEHDARTLYEQNYIRVWNEYIYMYAGIVDLPIRSQTGYERIADWAGRAACRIELQKLEREHGRDRVVEFLRKNSDISN